jgi:hypothetical protein
MRKLPRAREILAGRLQRRGTLDPTPYATHVPVLVGLAKQRPIRRVLEFGAGRYSTLLFLDRTVFPDLVALRTYEDNAEWAQEVIGLAGNDSRLDVQLVEDVPDCVPSSVDDYDLVFVDDSTTVDRRARTISGVVSAGLGPSLLVVHDFEHRPYLDAVATLPHVYAFRGRRPNVGVAWAGQVPGLVSDLRALRRRIESVGGSIDAADVTAWNDALEPLRPGRLG